MLRGISAKLLLRVILAMAVVHAAVSAVIVQTNGQLVTNRIQTNPAMSLGAEDVSLAVASRLLSGKPIVAQASNGVTTNETQFELPKLASVDDAHIEQLVY